MALLKAFEHARRSTLLERVELSSRWWLRWAVAWSQSPPLDEGPAVHKMKPNPGLLFVLVFACGLASVMQLLQLMGCKLVLVMAQRFLLL